MRELFLVLLMFAILLGFDLLAEYSSTALVYELFSDHQCNSYDSCIRMIRD